MRGHPRPFCICRAPDAPTIEEVDELRWRVLPEFEKWSGTMYARAAVR